MGSFDILLKTPSTEFKAYINKCVDSLVVAGQEVKAVLIVCNHGRNR